MAATGTPTPNIGLRIPIGTDPASVDDINYNSNLLDTKLGAVGNDSVQDQIDTLNVNFSKIQSGMVTGITLVANGQTDVAVTLKNAFSSGNDYIAVASIEFYGAASNFSAVLIRDKYAGSFTCRIHNNYSAALTNVILNWIVMPV